MQQNRHLIFFVAGVCHSQRYVIVGHVSDYTLVHTAGDGLHVDGAAAKTNQEIFYVLEISHLFFQNRLRQRAALSSYS